MLNIVEILSVSLILFSVIDILGNIPFIIDLRKKSGSIQSGKATIAAAAIMILFLYLGNELLKLFGIDVESFAIAGGIILFLLGLEMILGRNIFKANPRATKTSSIVPLAFPLLAGAGTLTTILSLRAEYHHLNILAGIIINSALVYAVLKSSKWLEKKIGEAGFDILRKVFGVILLSIAIKLIKTNLNL